MASQETPHNESLLSDYFNSTNSPSDNGYSTHIPSGFDNSDNGYSTHIPSGFDNSDNGYSTHTPSGFEHSEIIETMRAQDIISRSVYTYSVFGLVGLLTGIFILVIYIGNYRKKRKFETLDVILFSLTVADLTLILFSLTDIVRPNTVKTTALGCAVLSFFFNVSYFYTEYIHVVISFFLAYDHIALVRRVLSKPLISILAAMGLSILFSILVTALTGAGRDPHKDVNCHVDPLEAPPEYSIVKFVFGFLMPTLIILGFTLHFLIHSTCLRNSQDLQDCRERVHPHRVFLSLVTVTFTCRLVYNVLLLLRPREVRNQNGYLMKGAIMIIGELIMFAGSCLCLVSVVIFQEKKKDAAMETLRCITEPCQGINTNRNHYAVSSNIEINDHPEDNASLY